MKKMKSLLLAFSLLTTGSMIMFSCGPAAQRETAEEAVEEAEAGILSEEEIAQGFYLLFDGETSEGWRGYNREEFPASGWVIEDGVLMVQGKGTGEAGGEGGDIVYDKQFRDFHLKLEWKVSRGGNSGIFYLAQEIEGEPIWKSAPEMQILDNENHIDGQLGVDGNRKSGSLYDLIPAVPQNANPYDEWNEVEIMVYRGTVVHRMNGEIVLEYHLRTSDWDRMIENSKFADYKEWFGQALEGYIGLQDHGDDVWFRNIRIKEF
jgi:hypothetical protein